MHTAAAAFFLSIVFALLYKARYPFDACFSDLSIFRAVLVCVRPAYNTVIAVSTTRDKKIKGFTLSIQRFSHTFANDYY